VDGVLSRRYRLTTVGVLVLVTFIAFEAMAVGTAMPTAVRELDGLAWYGWPFSAFLVASVVGMVVGGDAGDRGGPRVALLTGIAVFAAGLLAAGLAGSMALFVAARAVQGAGAGAMVVSLYVVAGQAYPPELRPRLFGAISAAWVLPALLGPVGAGLVTTHVGWRWVFLGLLPLVALGSLLLLPALRRLPTVAATPEAAPRATPETRPAAGGPARRWWAVLAGLGLGLLQYAGQRRDGLGLLLGAAGLAALAAGLRPLLPRGTVRARPGLPTVVASRGLLAAAFSGMDVLLPLALTEVHGAGPTAAGLPLTAGAVGWALASHLQGRRTGASRVALLRAGFLLLATGLAATAVVAAPGIGAWPAYLTWAVAGLGMGLGMPSVGVLLLGHSPEHRRGADSASFQIADVSGAALSVGMVGVLVAAATAGLLPLPAAVVVAAGALAALALLGAAVAGRAGGPPDGSPGRDYPGARAGSVRSRSGTGTTG
jgi:MFS family permease